ncbi:MAG: TIGR02266 family protein [Desulfobacterales bacterium]|nr:TIGR02266 family protein [Desulfobacterales bacterium]
MLLTSGKETYEAGDVILKEGSHGSGVYILSSGKVEISKVVQDKRVVLDILGPGDMFGEMSYLDPAPRSATATALEDTVLELLDKNFLDKEFNQISSDFREIISHLVKRLRKTSENLVLSPRRSEERVRMKIRISFKKAGDLFRAYIGNLDSGGLFIKTTKSLPVDTLLNLEFNLPNTNRVIRTPGRVVWTRSQEMSTEKMPPGMGTEFVDMNPEDKTLLKKYLSLVKSS